MTDSFRPSADAPAPPPSSLPSASPASPASLPAAPPVRLAADARCPCLSGSVYGECCGPFHSGAAVAPTAEQLMRSRFSAFAVGDDTYLLATWHPSTRPASLELDETLRWYRLDILSRSGGGPLDSEGIVEFAAHHRPRPGGSGAAGVQHETSRFVREGGRWYYVMAV